jgi:poly(A) polymerase/tRNA nucleotidyltransferase (CCA-adding enzyme)
LEQLDILRYVLPELREGLGVGQNLHHIYSVFEHNVRALEYATEKNYSLEIRMASLLHDVGKPKVKAGDGPNSTFYNHDIVGAKMTARALDRLKFGRDFIEKVTHLVRYHLFYYNVGEVSDAGVRRFIRRVGPEHIDDLLKLREADRIGSGVPKAFPYRLRHLLYMIDKVRHDPVSPKMLKIDGGKVMEITALQPSPKIGQIINILLEEVIDDPEKNTEEYLESRTLELNDMPEAILVAMSEAAKNTKDEFEEGVEQDIKKKHRV